MLIVIILACNATQSAVMRQHVAYPSVCLSVRDVKVCFSHRSEYFENNFTTEKLKVYAWAGPIMGDLVQREHPPN